MITNRDIELAFVRAQARINEQLENAQAEFMLPDMNRMAGALLAQIKKSTPKKDNINNPISNEEI